MKTRCRLVVLIVVMVFVASKWSEAATKTWRGTGADALWSNPDNWVLNLVPVDGDDIVFPASLGPAVTTNDLTNLLVRSITLSATRTLNGNGIRLQAGITTTTAGSLYIVTIGLPIQLTSPQTWTIGADTRLTDTGSLDLNGTALTIHSGGVVGSFAQARLEGVVSGTGELIKMGGGNLSLLGANTYQGPTTINEGDITASVSGLGVSDGTAANGTTAADNGFLRVLDGVYPPEAIALTSSGISASENAVWTGPMTITGDCFLSAFRDPPGALRVEGVISGTGNLRVSAGAVTLANTNTYTGVTRLPAETIVMNFIRDAELTVAADEAIPQAPPLEVIGDTVFTVDRSTQTLAGLTTPTPIKGDAPFVTLTSTANPGETATLVLNGPDTYTYRAKFVGNGVIRHTGTGRQIFDADSTGLQGSLAVEHGTVVINQIHPVPVTVSADARLELSGRVAAVTVTDGEIALGKGTVANQTAGLTLSNATLETVGLVGSGGSELVGVTVVSGPVSVAGSTLVLELPFNFSAALNTQFILVDHAAAGPVTGTFVGLPEGGEITAGAFTFRITYVGGDGNDILLTLTKVTRTYLLSEGATSNFFTTDVLIANPQDAEVAAKVQFFPIGAPTVSMDLTLPALSRRTIRVNDIPGLAGAEFSTQVQSVNGPPLIVERTMTWDSTGYGAHTEHAAEALSTTWHFAEGSQGFFLTYLLLANPQDVDNVATVQYLRTNEAPIERTYPLSPRSRRTVDISTEPTLADRSFGMIVTFAQPAMAERAMYFGGPPLFTGGHESAGVTAPAATWFLPERATGPFFETFILLANPGSSSVDATVTFLPQGGQPVTVNTTIAAKGRTTINIEPQDPSLANAAVATQVTATGPIVAERAQYWPDPASSWYEAHNSFGVTELGTKWGLAEGRVGMTRAYQTYILLANPGDTAADTTITFLRDGKTAVTKNVSVPAKSRLNVSVGPGTMVPELQDETFGALIVSTQPIAVERAMYSDANGQVWAAGTSATAVRLP